MLKIHVFFVYPAGICSSENGRLLLQAVNWRNKLLWRELWNHFFPRELKWSAKQPLTITQYKLISNSNWTERSTIQGVIARVISKSDEREARGRFEITSTITPWIVRHEVQWLINRIYNKFRNSKNLIWAKTSVALILSFENCRKQC